MENFFLASIEELIRLEGQLDTPSAFVILHDAINSRSVDELIDLFYDLTPDTETEWLIKMDNIFAEMEQSEEVEDNINVRKIREMFRVGFCFLQFIPRILYLAKAMILYLLDILQYANYSKISVLRQQTKEGALPSVYFEKIMTTVSFATLLNIVLRAKELMTKTDTTPVEWNDLSRFFEAKEEIESSDEEADVLYRSFVSNFAVSNEKIDRSTWDDYRSYLLTCDNIFTSPDSTSVGTMCILS